jgi:O-acetyl-ADP-ribose deacetylase (regulator of RNase III)
MPAYAMDLPRDKEYFVDLHIGDPELIRLERGDITQYPADAIVNAANSDLLPGGGVCGAIHRAGGPAIAEECARIRSERGPLSPGQAVATIAGRLGAKYVIHTVGPVWQGGDQGEPEVLSRCYRESMRIADALKLHSIAFPAISTGIFGYPVEQAAWVAISSVIESLRSAEHLVSVSIVLFDKSSLDVFASATTSQRPPVSGNPYKVAIGIMNA